MRSFRLLLLAIVPMFALMNFSLAHDHGSVTLNWLEVAHDPPIIGYRLEWWSNTDSKTTAEVPPQETQWTINGLADCVEHSFSVIAYDEHGHESEQASVQSGWPRIRIFPIETGGPNGVAGSRNIVIQGANFRPGITISLDNETVEAEILGRSCTEMAVRLTYDQRPQGIQRFVLENPDGTKAAHGIRFGLSPVQGFQRSDMEAE